MDRGLGNRRVFCLVDSRVVLSVQRSLQQSTCELPSPSSRGLLLANNLSLDVCWVPSWANPSDAPSRFHSVSKWRTALPLFSRELHVTPEALTEAQVEVDTLLEPLSKGARAALKNLREKQAFPSDTVIKNTEPAKRTKIALDNKHAPIIEQRRDEETGQYSTFHRN